MIQSVLGESQLIPGHEHAPLDTVPYAGFHIRNWSIFSHRYHLLCLDNCLQFCINVLTTPVVLTSWVTVIADDIDQLMAWIPVCLWSAPDPDQIVDSVVLSESNVHELIEPLCIGVAFGSPPKPLTTSFMKRSP